MHNSGILSSSLAVLENSIEIKGKLAYTRYVSNRLEFSTPYESCELFGFTLLLENFGSDRVRDNGSSPCDAPDNPNHCYGQHKLINIQNISR